MKLVDGWRIYNKYYAIFGVRIKRLCFTTIQLECNISKLESTYRFPTCMGWLIWQLFLYVLFVSDSCSQFLRSPRSLPSSLNVLYSMYKGSSCDITNCWNLEIIPTLLITHKRKLSVLLFLSCLLTPFKSIKKKRRQNAFHKNYFTRISSVLQKYSFNFLIIFSVFCLAF